MLNVVPKQMRYQAAPLPDGSFPRGRARGSQPVFGTGRKQAARCGTIAAQNAAHIATPSTNPVTEGE